MAKGAYANSGGIAHKSAKIYVNVNGVARKVKKVYANVNGVARICYRRIDTISTVPSPSNIPVYNGAAQSPTWTGFDSTKMTISGNTSGINAGTYTATFTAKEGFQWSDGSTVKNVQWSIGRATISVAPSQKGSLTYTGGAISPSWNNYNSAQLSIGGTTSAVNAGTYTATFTPTGNYKWSNGTTGAVNVSWVINRAVINTVPSQNGGLTYNGATQAPIWANYNAAMLSIGGSTSAVNSGSYSASFTPTGNYRWSDGTTTAKYATWSIGKAPCSITLSETSLRFADTYQSTNRTVSVSRSGDGAISAISSDADVARCSANGTNVGVVSGSKNGNCVITVNVAEGTNHTAASATIAVTREVYYLGDLINWAGYTWEVVHRESGRMYLALDHIHEKCMFNSTTYANSVLAARAKAFEESLPQADLARAHTMTEGGVSAKIFPPSEWFMENLQLFTAQGRRVCKYNGVASSYWTCTMVVNVDGYVMSVDSGGNLLSADAYRDYLGFRPMVALTP